ncbi:MAG TPA: hypothetical protein VFE65_31630 [Pseudonocardia sp.]|nr:hypothetical protein [Pseudonocardia sp.]
MGGAGPHGPAPPLEIAVPPSEEVDPVHGDDAREDEELSRRRNEPSVWGQVILLVLLLALILTLVSFVPGIGA